MLGGGIVLKEHMSEKPYCCLYHPKKYLAIQALEVLRHDLTNRLGDVRGNLEKVLAMLLEC
jgi:hypothetical protein